MQQQQASIRKTGMMYSEGQKGVKTHTKQHLEEESIVKSYLAYDL